MQKLSSIPEKTILLALGLAAFLILYFTKASQVSGMSIGFATSVKANGFHFHPHHLLYQPVLNLFHGLVGSPNCDAICGGQLHSMIWGVVAIMSTYVISRHAVPSRLGAVLAAMSLFAIHGFAVYATQLEPYVPILGMTSLLAAILAARGSQKLGWPYEILFISVMSLSLLFHQAMLFFFVPLAYWLIANNGRNGLWSFIRIIAATGAIVLFTYVAVFLAQNPDEGFTEFYHWIMYYQVISDTTHGTFQDLFERRLRIAVFAITQLFVALRGTQMPDAVFLARLFVSIYIPVLMLWSALQIYRSNDKNKIRTMMFIWTAILGLFFFWWKASVYKFFIPIIVPIVVLTFISINDFLERWHQSFFARNMLLGITLAGVILIGGFNFTMTVYPLSRSPGAIVNLAEKLAKAAPEECNIYSMRYLSSYLAYYFDRGSPRPFNLMFRKHYYSTKDAAVADTIGVESTFDEERCAVIPLYWLSREYFSDRSKQPIGRYLTPDDWSQFITWFFEVEKIPNSTAISFSLFEISEDADGDRFVLLDRTTRQDAASINVLLEQLMSQYTSGPAGSFALVNNPEIGLRRHLAFGYN